MLPNKNLENLQRSCCFSVAFHHLKPQPESFCTNHSFPPTNQPRFPGAPRTFALSLAAKVAKLNEPKNSTSPKKWRTHKNCRNVMGLNAWVSSKSWGRNFHLLPEKNTHPKNEDETLQVKLWNGVIFPNFPCFFGSPCVFAMRFLGFSSDRCFGPPGPGIFRTVHGFVHTEDHMFADLPWNSATVNLFTTPPL